MTFSYRCDATVSRYGKVAARSVEKRGPVASRGAAELRAAELRAAEWRVPERRGAGPS